MEGLEGIGHASVLGGSVNPLQLYIQQGYNKQRQQAVRQEHEIKQRDAILDENRKWNPDASWAPFHGQVANMANEIRDFTIKAIEQGMPRNQIDLIRGRMMSDTNSVAAKSNGLKQFYDSMNTVIEKDPELKQNEAKSALNNHFFNGINGKPINDIPGIEEIGKTLNNSKLYDIDAVTTNFMKGLPEQINKYYTDLYGQLGKDYDITQTETKLGHEYTVGKDGQRHIVVDPTTGLPKVNMTDDVFVAAMQNPKLRNLVKDNVGENATVDQKRAYLTQILKAKDKNSIQKGILMGHAKSEAERGGEAVNQNISDRFQRTERVVTGYHPEDLANIFDPSEFSGKDQKVIYTDANGKEWNDKFVGSPPIIHMEVRKNDPNFMYAAFSEKDPVIRKQMLEDHDKPFKRDFDITTEKGRRDWHEISNRLLDAQMGQKERLGEKYSKYVSEQYQKRGPAGSLNASDWKKKK